MAIPYVNKFQGWNLTTPNSGDDFDDEFDQIYANTNYLEAERLNLEQAIVESQKNTVFSLPVHPLYLTGFGVGHGVEIRSNRAQRGAGNNVDAVTTSDIEIPGAAGVLNGAVRAICLEESAGVAPVRSLILWGDGAQGLAVVATTDPVTETTIYGTPFVFHGSNISEMSVARYVPDGAGERIVVFYNDGANATARVLSTNLTIVTGGTPVVVQAGDMPGLSVAITQRELALTPAVGCFVFISAGDCDSKGFSITGTTIDVGPLVEVSNNAPGDMVDIVAMSTTKVVVGFNRSSNNSVRIVVGRGSTVGPGTTAFAFDGDEVVIFDYDDLGGPGPNLRSINLIALDHKRCMVQHSADTVAYTQMLEVQDVPGDGVVVAGAATRLLGAISGSFTRANSLAVLSSNKAIYVTDGATKTECRAFEIAGDEIVNGVLRTGINIGGNVGASMAIDVAVLNASLVLVAFADLPNAKIRTVICDVSKFAGYALTNDVPVPIAVDGLIAGVTAATINPGAEYMLRNDGAWQRHESHPPAVDTTLAGAFTYRKPSLLGINATDVKIL